MLIIYVYVNDTNKSFELIKSKHCSHDLLIKDGRPLNM